MNNIYLACLYHDLKDEMTPRIKGFIDILQKEYSKEIERLKEELECTIPIVEHNKTITKHLKEIERLNYIIDKQDRDITSLTKSKLILKERYNKAIEFIKENESNISSIKDLENNKTYNIALLRVKDILQGVDKE